MSWQVGLRIIAVTDCHGLASEHSSVDDTEAKEASWVASCSQALQACLQHCLLLLPEACSYLMSILLPAALLGTLAILYVRPPEPCQLIGAHAACHLHKSSLHYAIIELQQVSIGLHGLATPEDM